MALERFKIKNRITRAVQVTAEIECEPDESVSIKLGFAVRWAIKNHANLSGADLSGANLSGANLSGANLSGANLSRAYLYGADLSRAYLSGANLSGANLSGADLSRANLSGANLSRAYLYGADLSRAYLSRADLSCADLGGAKGIQGFVSFGPVGKERRNGWATIEDGAVKIRLGCSTGNLDETCVAIRKKYGEGSTYEALVRAAVAEMLAHSPAEKSQAA